MEINLKTSILLLIFVGGPICFFAILTNMILVCSNRREKTKRSEEEVTLLNVEVLELEEIKPKKSGSTLPFWIINPAFGFAAMLVNQNHNQETCYFLSFKDDKKIKRSIKIPAHRYEKLKVGDKVEVNKISYEESYKLCWFEMMVMGTLNSKVVEQVSDYELARDY